MAATKGTNLSETQPTLWLICGRGPNTPMNAPHMTAHKSVLPVFSVRIFTFNFLIRSVKCNMPKRRGNVSLGISGWLWGPIDFVPRVVNPGSPVDLAAFYFKILLESWQCRGRQEMGGGGVKWTKLPCRTRNRGRCSYVVCALWAIQLLGRLAATVQFCRTAAVPYVVLCSRFGCKCGENKGLQNKGPVVCILH